MRRNPGILAGHYAKLLVEGLPTSHPFISRQDSSGWKIRMSLRRCYRVTGPWDRRYELTGGAVLTVESINADVLSSPCLHQRARCEIRLKCGWTENAVARAITRGWAKVFDAVHQIQRAAAIEKRFGSPSDEIVAQAETFAASIGWDCIYDTLTEEQAEQFHVWMDANGWPKRD